MTIQNSSYNPIYNTVFIYIVIMTIIIIIKPSPLFNTKNKSLTTKCILKPFGCGQNKTIFTIHAVGIILSIILYFFSSLYQSMDKI